MRENSVTEIRRRFLKNGIDSIMDKERSGRPTTKLPAEEVEPKVRDVISSSFASGAPIPSVKEIAKDLNASEKNVRDVLNWTVKSFRVPQAARFPEEPPFSS